MTLALIRAYGIVAVRIQAFAAIGFGADVPALVLVGRRRSRSRMTLALIRAYGIVAVRVQTLAAIGFGADMLACVRRRRRRFAVASRDSAHAHHAKHGGGYQRK